MNDETREDPLREELVDGLRKAREEARSDPETSPRTPAEPSPSRAAAPLGPLEIPPPESLPTSPDREELNRVWNISEAPADAPGGRLGRWLSPLRSPLRRLLRFAQGPVTERQVRMNSAQVRFDNELVRYVDERFDAISRNYDRVLGLHGRRMEEIDERHLILQQELVRHVHDLVARIELVFEAAEQNHLYLEGMLRETREELSRIASRLEALAKDER